MVVPAAFGGPDLRTLYITSAAVGTEGEEGAGGLWSMRVDVPGLPEGTYHG